MNDTARTGAYLGGAALLVALALMTGPTEKQPEQFDDQGQLFFENFNDPLAAAELEVWSFDCAETPAIPSIRCWRPCRRRNT